MRVADSRLSYKAAGGEIDLVVNYDGDTTLVCRCVYVCGFVEGSSFSDLELKSVTHNGEKFCAADDPVRCAEIEFLCVEVFFNDFLPADNKEKPGGNPFGGWVK